MSVLPQIGVRSVSLTNSLALAFALVSSTKAVDLWDFDRDGLSDIWQNAFDAQDLNPEDDEDGDGFTNLDRFYNIGASNAPIGLWQ